MLGDKAKGDTKMSFWKKLFRNKEPVKDSRDFELHEGEVIEVPWSKATDAIISLANKLSVEGFKESVLIACSGCGSQFRPEAMLELMVWDTTGGGMIVSGGRGLEEFAPIAQTKPSQRKCPRCGVRNLRFSWKRQPHQDMRIVEDAYTLPGRTIRPKVGKEGVSFELVSGTAEDIVILPSGASLEVVREERDPQVLAATAKQHWDPGVRVAAARRITDEALLEEIAASVPENSEVYRTVHRSLAKLRDRRAKEGRPSKSEQVPTDTLMAQLNASSPEKRMEAITALAARKEKVAIPALIDMLEDTDVSVRLRATEALAWITGEDFGEDKQAWISWRSEHQ